MLPRAWIMLAGVGVLNAHGGLPTGPLSPKEATAAFKLEPGIEAKCVAWEPLVQSPSALAFNDQGHLFVAENRGYPSGPPPGQMPLGRIARLQDSDGDGVFDRRTEFAEGLTFPNGLMWWQGGVLVSCSPDLLYLKDADNDGRADIREIWFTGFDTHSTPQLRACYPTLGPDGWIYLSRGWSGGTITSPKWPSLASVDLKDGDFRFRPDGSAAEAIGGNGQFGLAFDPFGRRFIVSSRNPLMHAVTHRRSWDSNPAMPFREVVQDVSPTGAEAKVLPAAEDLTTSGFSPELMSQLQAGTFTSACGIHYNLSLGLGGERQGNWFICEPAQALIQRQLITPNGASFRSRRASETQEFVTSTDSWHHPVFLCTGPDGFLYVADMYRKTIDHPDRVPDDARKRLDFESGRYMGRIWRFKDKEALTEAGVRVWKNDGMAVAEAVRDLRSRNPWVRESARRRVIEFWFGLSAEDRRNSSWVASLRTELVKAGKEASGAWVRSGVTQLLRIMGGRLPQDLGWDPTRDPAAGVREQAVLWMDDLLVNPDISDHEAIRSRCLDLAEDPDPRVRFQALLTLAKVRDADRDILRILVNRSSQDASDRWLRTAILSHARLNHTLAMRLGADASLTDTNLKPLLRELGHSIGATPTESKAALALKAMLSRGNAHPVWLPDFVRGIATGLRSRGFGNDKSPLDALSNTETGRQLELSAGLEQLRAGSIQLARGTTHSTLKAGAASVLGEFDNPESRQALEALLDDREAIEVQREAAAALGGLNDESAAELLTSSEHWPSYPPTVRDMVITALTTQPRHAPVLLSKLESGAIPTWLIQPDKRNRLKSLTDPSLRERAQKLFESVGGADRRKVYEQHKDVLQLAADVERGRDVFRKACLSCHQHYGEGAKVGPDLTGLRNQPGEALLLHILVPDAEIHPGFESYAVETLDGRLITGLLVSETPSEITLRASLGAEETISRSNIEARRLSPLSMMPQGFEETLTRQELADLIGFLKQTSNISGRN